MPNKQAWVEKYKYLLKRGGGGQVLNMGVHNWLIKIRECFWRANICNQSESFYDTCMLGHKCWLVSYIIIQQDCT